MANKPNNPALWSRAKSLAKQKFDVYPSAYANGWAAKYYKSKGGTWRKGENGMIMEKGGINNPGFQALPESVQQKIKSNMEMGGSSMGMMGALSQVVNKPQTPMVQMGGVAQTSQGQSVLKEAMMNSMQNGGKMPTDIARARFMAAANGNESAAKAKASQYGYKLQGGGGPLRFGNSPVMSPSQPGFNFQQASAAAVSQGEAPTDIERMTPIDIRKKRSFSEKVAGKYRQAKKALGFDPYPKTESQQGMDAVLTEGKNQTAQMRAVNAKVAAENKKADRNLLQRIGDEFPTYLNLTSDRNVLTDLTDIGTVAATKLGATETASQLQRGKKAIQDFGDSKVAKGLDYINPLSISANLVGGSLGVAGDVQAGEYEDAVKRGSVTSALALTKGTAGKLSSISAAPVGKGLSKISPESTAHFVQHQAKHAGEHGLLNFAGLLAHKNGGTIKDMYMMKKGGQFPDRYKKMGFKGVDQPKRTPGASKSHAVVTKVGGDYKLIRFGQQGVSGSPDGSARNKAFKARHAKNIAKGKSSAAYWANKIKW